MKGLTVEVPGKIMLAGEYAVLQGGSCLAATVSTGLTLRIQARNDRQQRVASDLWSETFHLESCSDSLIKSEPLLHSLATEAKRLPGFELTVRSHLNIAHGLGSSSAIRLASKLALKAFAEQRLVLSENERRDCARQAWLEQREQQGFASGYDVLTQLEGGLIDWTPDFTNWPGSFMRYDSEILGNVVHPFVGGHGAPTSQQGLSVRQWLQNTQGEATLLQLSENLMKAWRQVLMHQQDFEQLLAANAEHRSFLSKAPGFPSKLHETLAALPGFDQSWSYKTTGAGGEDAILLLGTIDDLTAARAELKLHGWHALGASWQNRGATLSSLPEEAT